MLSEQENDYLTRVGPGTPCGELLRRYWQPVCHAAELTPDDPARPVKILGEELVVFRLPDGTYGCMDEHCAHRRTSLAYGWVEKDGIRCPYHGWKYDCSGQCTEQPFEPAGSNFKQHVRLKAYPAQGLGGLVWVYMGPTPAPELPRWDLLVWTNGRRLWGRQPVLNCNWLQIVENSADVTHTYFLHGHMLYTTGDRSKPSMRLYRPFEGYGFQPNEWGMVKSWQYGQTELWPAAKEAGNMFVFPTMVRFATDMQWRVPADDTHTHVFAVTFQPGDEVPPEAREVVEDAVSHYRPDGRYDKTTIWAQDRMAWETQGDVCDRTKEHLGVTDRGVIMYRQMLKEQIQRVQNGQDPVGVMREPQDIVELPLDQYVGGSGKMSMWDYMDERYEWYEVPDGAARKPGEL